MMNQALINIETAKLADEKGFEEKHADFFISKKLNGDLTAYPRVPQSFLQAWLREKHNILVYCMPTSDGKGWYWQISVFPDNCTTDFQLEEIKTYETALEQGLYEALKLIP